MTLNFSAQAGGGQISLFELSDSSGKSIDMMQGNPIFEYYESILDHTVRSTVTLIDSGYRSGDEQGSILESVNSETNTNTGKFLSFKVRDAYDNEISFIEDKKMRVISGSNIADDANKSSFILNMTSIEHDDNNKLKCAVDKRYDGKIDETVRKILSECLKTPKTLDADPTLNTLSVRGLNRTPFEVCGYLSSRSVPDIPNSYGNVAGYFFYETADGYKFKSIDKLFEQAPKRKLIYNQLSTENLPPGYDGKILMEISNQFQNLETLRKSGAFGKTEIRTFDISPGNSYKTSEFSHTNQFNSPQNNGGLAPIKYGSDQEDITRRFFVLNNKGVMPTGSIGQQLEKKNELNYDAESIMRQSIMRYNSLFAIKLSIIVDGDLSLRAGDLIHCDFPKVSGDYTKLVSETKSGIYMITDLCHRVSKDGCLTSLNLVRDSIGRKPIQR